MGYWEPTTMILIIGNSAFRIPQSEFSYFSSSCVQKYSIVFCAQVLQ
jgi:hypothetical protein